MRKILLFLFFLSLPLLARPTVFLPNQNNLHPGFFLNEKEPHSYLRFLEVNGRIEDIAKIGLKFSMLQIYPLQISPIASIRVHMLPVKSKFNVERFTAALGLSMDLKIRKNLYASLSPLYHESSHLADGYTGDVSADSRTVSNESLQIKLIWCPERIIVPVQIDWYWHTVKRTITVLAGTGAQYRKKIMQSDYMQWDIFGSIFGHIFEEDGWKTNLEFSLGTIFATHKKSLRISYYWQNQYDQGQFFDQRQKGSGLEISFGGGDI